MPLEIDCPIAVGNLSPVSAGHCRAKGPCEDNGLASCVRMQDLSQDMTVKEEDVK
jgi:hypothetical protein